MSITTLPRRREDDANPARIAAELKSALGKTGLLIRSSAALLIEKVDHLLEDTVGIECLRADYDIRKQIANRHGNFGRR
jgi:hypothetical protein